MDYVFTVEELAMRRSMTIAALVVVLAMECGTNFFGSRAEAAVITVFSNSSTTFSYELTETAGQPKVAASLIMSDGAVTKARIWYTLGETKTSGTYHFGFEGLKGIVTGKMQRYLSGGDTPDYIERVYTEIKDVTPYKSESGGYINGLFQITGQITTSYVESLTAFIGEIAFPVEWSSTILFPPEAFDLPWMDRTIIPVNVPIIPNVPEPTSLAVVALGGIVLLRRRR